MRAFGIESGGLASLMVSLLVVQLAAEAPQDRPRASSVDFSGVELFLELTAVLERDEEPSVEEWDALFATPGYAVLIEREFRRDFFIENFRLAFMPSQREALVSKLAEDQGFMGQFLPHYVRARESREIILEELEDLNELSFVDKAIEKAAALLPGVDPGDYPPISFVVFGPDARGYSPVVIDVLHLRDRGEFLTSFVAHEFHHYYRDRFLKLSQDRDILWVINQVQAEGIADQINVGEWFHDPALFEEHSTRGRNPGYLEWYDRSPEIIRRMDSLFSQMLRHPEDRGRLGSDLRAAVPLSGHPTAVHIVIHGQGNREVEGDPQ